MKTAITIGALILNLCVSPVVDAADRNVDLEVKTKLHHYNEDGFSIYDAFSYVNRIPDGKDTEFPGDPIDTAGRIMGRIGNQQGRVQLKLPSGMTKSDYLAFVQFFNEGTQTNVKVANCGACHSAGSFKDTKKHVVTKGGQPVATPSLRNLDKPAVAIANAIRQHITASQQAKSGNANDVDAYFKAMNISAEDVAGLVSFVELLRDEVGRQDTAERIQAYFRPLVMNAQLVDVIGAEARGEVAKN